MPIDGNTSSINIALPPSARQTVSRGELSRRWRDMEGDFSAMLEIDTAKDVSQIRQCPARIDRILAVVILIFSLLTYAYIFQGVGWNQVAHFGTIRSIVERHTAEITPFTNLTNDTMVVGTRQYSNKPPGLALLGVPFYFLLFHIEKGLGIPFDDTTVWLKNLHVMTILLCALPGAILNVLIYFAFRREGATPRTSMLLAGGFAFGSLSLPYTGLFMSHVLCSMLAFAAWYRLTGPRLSAANAFFAGALIGYCNLCDLLTSLITIGLGLYLIFRKTDFRCWFAFAAGPFAAVLALLTYDRIAHGNAAQISAFQPTAFYNPHLFLGQFDWPDIRRLYWITYQPMRGLISCCPEFVLCLFAPLLWRKGNATRWDLLAMLPMLAGYLIFYMTYFGWTGGWAVGPRFLIPLLPLLWMFSFRPYQKMPLICGVIIALSIIYMLAITSVCAVDPARDNGNPTRSDPVGADLILFIHGRVTDVWMSETLGGLAGVPKQFLIVPFLLPVVAYFGCALALPRKPRPRLESD